MYDVFPTILRFYSLGDESGGRNRLGNRYSIRGDFSINHKDGKKWIELFLM